MGFKFLKLRTMKKHIVFFLKRSYCIAALHIANVWFVANDVLPAIMCCSKTSKSCVLKKINVTAKRCHFDRSLKVKYKVFQEPLIWEVRRSMEMLEDFSLYSELGEGIMNLVKEVNHYVDREDQKTRKQSNITDCFNKIIERLKMISRLIRDREEMIRDW